MSSTASPPNFSMNASASTRHIIASPTTAAAGTAHTSLRSMAAAAAAIVSSSTDRSGFISVEIGFIHAVTRTSSPFVTPPSSPAGVVGRTGQARQRAARRARASPQFHRARAIPADGRRRSQADADGLDRGDRHHRLRETPIKLLVPLRLASEARGNAMRDHFEGATDRVAGVFRRVDGLSHLGRGV